MISAIVAASENHVIGKDNKMPWHMPADLRFFKSKTNGNVIIMGRKTFEALNGGLKNRVNIVITRKENYAAENAIVATSVDDALAKAKEFSDKEIFIIGGEEIFRQTMDCIDRFYLTRIHHQFDGDTFFPQLSEEKWKLVDEENHTADEKNPYDYSFLTYDRVR